MNRNSSLAILLALASTGAPAALALNLKGRVLDKAGMVGVSGAKVRAGGLLATTDSSGRFTLAGATAVRDERPGAVLDPYFRDGSLFVEAGNAEGALSSKVEWFGLSGASLAAAVDHPVHAGWNRLPVPGPANRDALGYVRVTQGGRTWILRYFRERGGTIHGLRAGNRAAALPKSAPGTVEVTAAGLLQKSLAYASDNQDLGDIVLDYPPRKLGVGAPPIYGAVTLFDGSKGRAAAAEELQGKWKDWPRFTPSTIMFGLARDPQFPADSNRVTLQSCCNPNWGYDDIQAKVGLFQDVQIHVEFIGMGEYDTPKDSPALNANAGAPSNPGAAGYINSGVYVASRYEVQIQSFSTDAGTLPGNHDMGAIVDAYTPLANKNKPNGEWQAYDITYRGARFSGTAMTANPFMSVWWNGVLVHDNRKVNAGASGLANHSGEEHNDPLVYGLKLQSEGRDVRFRNIWVRKLDLAEPQTNVGF